MTANRDVGVVEALYRAFAAGDHDGILRCLSQDLQWRQAGSAVPAAGEDAAGGEQLLERVVRPLERDWDGFAEEIEDIFEADGTVVAVGTYRGTYRPSGRTLEAEFCHLWRVRDGRIRSFRQYTDTAAFADAMEPDGGR